MPADTFIMLPTPPETRSLDQIQKNNRLRVQKPCDKLHPKQWQMLHNDWTIQALFLPDNYQSLEPLRQQYSLLRHYSVFLVGYGFSQAPIDYHRCAPQPVAPTPDSWMQATYDTETEMGQKESKRNKHSVAAWIYLPSAKCHHHHHHHYHHLSIESAPSLALGSRRPDFTGCMPVFESDNRVIWYPNCLFQSGSVRISFALLYFS